MTTLHRKSAGLAGNRILPQRAAVILEAEVGSGGRPAVALARLGSRSVIGWSLDRLKASLPGMQVYLSTTTRRDDDVLEREATAMRVRTLRGPADDPLRRLRIAAASVGARFVLRAIAGRPLIDLDGPSRLLTLIAAADADYVAERGLPHGADVEAMSMVALQRADARVTDPVDRQAVTAVLRREHQMFKSLEVSAPARVRRPDLRFTVDTPAALSYVEGVLAQVDAGSGEPSLVDIIAAADRVTEAAAR